MKCSYDVLSEFDFLFNNKSVSCSETGIKKKINVEPKLKMFPKVNQGLLQEDVSLSTPPFM